MRISDWSSDVCSSDLAALLAASLATGEHRACGIEVAAVMAEALFTEIIGDAAMLYLSQPCVDRTAIAADIAQHQHKAIAGQGATLQLACMPTAGHHAQPFHLHGIDPGPLALGPVHTAALAGGGRADLQAK